MDMAMKRGKRLADMTTREVDQAVERQAERELTRYEREQDDLAREQDARIRREEARRPHPFIHDEDFQP